MSQASTTSKDGPTSRGRGRGRGRGTPRGGLGKYLRASGRGRGRGRPAEFTQRLLFDGEGKPDLTEEEAVEAEKELREKYGRRRLGTNADRYKEEEVELDSDGEPIVEPEVDLASFLEKQRISDGAGPTSQLLEEKEEDQDEILYLDSLNSRTTSSKKGNLQQIEWSEELEELNQEKNAAEAARDLKERFKSKSEKLRTKPIISSSSSARIKKPGGLKAAPPLPLPGGVQSKPKSQIEEMEDFLDELLG